MALSAAMPTAAKLDNTAYIGRDLFQVANEVYKQCQTHCEDLIIFSHGQYLTGHRLDCIVLDSSQQMADLGVFVQAAVALLHQVLGNVLLLNMGINVLGPIRILLLPMVGQAGEAGFHLVGKVVHGITAKIVGKQETIQLVAILLLLGQGGMKPSRHLPKHSYRIFHTITMSMWKVLQKGPFSSSNAMAATDWPGRAISSSRIDA